MIPEGIDGMRLVSLHADGCPHRIWTGVHTTPVPGAYVVPRNAPVHESNGTSWTSDYPVVAFFWPKLYYQVFMLLKKERTDYYANIILPPLFGPNVYFVDLDLDVTVVSGRVELQDELEFMERQSSYPISWIHEAHRAAQRVVQLATSGEGPFRPATASQWRTLVENM